MGKLQAVEWKHKAGKQKKENCKYRADEAEEWDKSLCKNGKTIAEELKWL